MDSRSQRIEQTICKIATMGKVELVEMLNNMQCDFKFDFSQEFLDSLPLDKLRHIVMAASLHDNSHAA